MTTSYVTTKIVAAWPEEREGKEGYAVRYPDGYMSWCPKDTFERTSRPINDDERVLVETYTHNTPFTNPYA